MTEVNIINMGTSQNHLPPDRINEKNSVFWGVPVTDAEPDSSGEISDKPRSRDILQNNWPCLFKTSKLKSTKKRLIKIGPV